MRGTETKITTENTESTEKRQTTKSDTGDQSRICLFVFVFYPCFPCFPWWYWFRSAADVAADGFVGEAGAVADFAVVIGLSGVLQRA